MKEIDMTATHLLVGDGDCRAHIMQRRMTMKDTEFIEKALANLRLGEKLYPKAVDRLITLARIGAAVQPHLHGDKPFCEECGLPIGWCNANALLKLAEKKIERLEAQVKP